MSKDIEKTEMTQAEYLAAVDGVIYLAACAVKNIAPDAGRIAGLNLDHAFEVADDHMLSAAVGMALEKAGCKNQRFIRTVAMAQRRTILMDADRAAITARMEEQGIWYAPLKGIVMKDLYPRLGMRQMVDNDILFDAARQEDVRDIMVGLGFEVKSYGKMHDDSYLKLPVSNFEMHISLFDHRAPAETYSYYKNVKDRLIKDPDNAWGRHFSNEDFYLYMVAHEYQHYLLGGVGIRSLLDTWIYLDKVPMDMAYVAREAEKIGIADFERRNRELALRLFEGGALENKDREMLEFMLGSGTFGNRENLVDKKIAEKGRVRYFLSRMTLPYDLMAEMYPILRKAPVLYPFAWTHRLVSAVVKRREKVAYEVKSVLGLKGSGDDKKD